MNGFIHPCFHPANRQQPKSYNEVISTVNPQKLVYLAIDGVAPRAKMNQQRLRRYNSAFINQYNNDKQDIQNENQQQGDLMDSNIITPGTPFMKKLEKIVQQYILSRQSGKFSHLTFIFSSSNVPGEGEHKIMNWIKIQRQQKNYDPETTHCLHGLDADLIFLALCTHELNFYIFREIVLPKQGEIQCKICGQIIQENSQHAQICPYQNQPPQPVAETMHFQYLSVGMLRQCLQNEFNINDSYKFEQIIIDFTFICFSVGNDFLPQLMCMNINDNGILRIIKYYKKYYEQNKKFIIECKIENRKKIYKVNYYMLLKFLSIVQEDELFVLRLHQRNFENRSQYRKERSKKELENALNEINIQQYTEQEQQEMRDELQALQSETQLQIQAEKYNQYSQQLQDQTKLKAKYIFRELDFNQDMNQIREQYYYDNQPKIINDMCLDYLMVMQWICTYYTSIQDDVTTFYHYYQAPLLTDLVKFLSQNLQLVIQSQEKLLYAKQEKNLRPYQQLLSVLPENTIKKIGGILYQMQQQIQDQYQKQFEIDLTMCIELHQGVTKLNFIDIQKIKNVYEQNYQFMTEEEKEMNIIDQDHIYASITQKQGKKEYAMIQKDPQLRQEMEQQILPDNTCIYAVKNCKVCYSGLYKEDDKCPQLQSIVDVNFGQAVYQDFPVNNQYIVKSVEMKYVPKLFIFEHDIAKGKYTEFLDQREWNGGLNKRQRQDQRTEDEINYFRVENQHGRQNQSQNEVQKVQQTMARKYQQGQIFVPGRNNQFGQFVNK